jgi:hypothetical protein
VLQTSNVSKNISSALVRAALSLAQDKDERRVIRSVSETTSSDASDVHLPASSTGGLKYSAAAVHRNSTVRDMAAAARSIVNTYTFNLGVSDD